MPACQVDPRLRPASSQVPHLHSVAPTVLPQEVFSQEKPRMSIQGWFHTDQVRGRMPAGMAPAFRVSWPADSMPAVAHPVTPFPHKPLAPPAGARQC